MPPSTPPQATGARRSPPDPRDFKLSFLAGAPAPVVWRKGRLGRPRPPQTNQGSSDVCVAEGTSTAHWTIGGLRFAVRSIFPYIALQWGAYLRDGPKRVYNFGQQPYVQVPDPEPKTMQNMRKTDGLDPAKAAAYKAFNFFQTNGRDIEQVAQAIRD